MAEHARGFRIAIIGMACRFPGAQTCEEFWANLANGVESIRRYSREELLGQGVPATLFDQPSFVPAAPLLSDVGDFDADLFGLPPHEARLLDPQQRLLLEVAWESLERAGHDPARFDGPVGIFAGTGIPSYAFENLREGYSQSAGFEAMLANDKDYVASRIAYKLGLRGPAIAVQTACSTSLVALHLACQSLLAGECDMALAAAVSIRIPHIGGYVHQAGMIASPDGHCRAFDAAAAGTVSSSGAGVLVLRRLEEALESGDNILAVVRGSAVNNDGSLKAGFTAPSTTGQAAVIREAIAVAGLEPEDISYVEGHGTATPLGDPVEVDALNEVFGSVAERGGRCALGSVKTNIGHTDTAAGMAGVIKSVLAMQHGELPASLHFSQPNPDIRFERGPFEVVRQRRTWPSAGPRRAGVSSFGIGGTNAHVVLEEWKSEAAPKTSSVPVAIPLSAHSKEALQAHSAQMADWLEQHPQTPISSVAFTLACGRKELPWRTYVIAREAGEAVAALRSHTAAIHASTAERPSIALAALPGIDGEQSDDRSTADRIGRRWAHGERVDWEGYLGQYGGRRLALPTYPFERKRYWIDPVNQTAGARRPVNEWFYLPWWKPAGQAEVRPGAASFLLIGDETPLRSDLARLLEGRGAEVRCAAEPVATDFAAETHRLHCVFLRPLGDYSDENSFLTCYSKALRLLQTIVASNGATRITFVSRAVEPVLSSAAKVPLAAMLTGLVMAAGQELRGIRVGSIDLGLNDSAEDLMDALQTNPPEPSFAWRSGRAWVRAYRQLVVPQNDTAPFRRNLVCIITGGLGSIGLTLAEHLAKSAHAKLALIGRSQFPDRSKWSELENDVQFGERIRRLRNLEAAGAEVMTLQADAADASAMRDAVEKVRDRFGKINGAVHAAGVAGGGLLAVRNPADADLVLRPKVLGAIALAEALSSDKLDFLVFCGSLTAIAGGFSHADYIAGNAFLDSFAHSLQARGVPAMAIDWDTWGESGMAVSSSIPAELRALWAPFIANGIRDVEGGKVFERALGLAQPRVVISTTSLEARLAQSTSELDDAMRKLNEQHTEVPAHPRPKHLPAPEPAVTELEARLCEAFAANLGFAPVGVRDDYFECGGDSLTGISLISRVEAALGETVHVTALFEAPSPQQLAAYLEANYAQPVSRWISGAAAVQAEERKLAAADFQVFRDALPRTGPRSSRPTKRNPRMVFLLSPPRTGSTLLRAMLAGHPKLFAPPELALLSFNTFGERNSAASEDAGLFDGPVQALMNALGCTWEQARSEMEAFGPSALTADFYARLQCLIGDRLLVDKTPHYVLDIETLRRAEEHFEDPLYIMLQRHPYGMIRSYVESRIDLLLPERLRKGTQFTRRQIGELIWTEGYRNMREFSSGVPAHRQHWIKFEDLTQAPADAMRGIAEFLGVEFDERTLNPYSDEEKRMTGALRAGSRPLGDVKFHRYTGVEFAVAERWREEYTQDFLSDEAAAVARAMGYALLSDHPQSIQPRPIDELTDAEVEAELTRYFEPTA